MLAGVPLFPPEVFKRAHCEMRSFGSCIEQLYIVDRAWCRALLRFLTTY